MRQSKPEALTATFIAAVLFGFVVAFGGAGAAEGDGEFTVEGRGTVGGEVIDINVDGTTVATVTFTTTSDTYTVNLPPGTTWSQIEIYWPDGIVNGQNRDIDLYSFDLDGDVRTMVAGDVEASGQWVSGQGCTTLGDPVGNRLHCIGMVVFPAQDPPPTTEEPPVTDPPVTDPPPTTVPPMGALVVINELHYNPADPDDDDGEFLELHNPGDTDIDLTGFTLDDADSAAEGTTLTLSGTLPAGGYAILVADGSTAWDGVTTFGSLPFGLGGGGDEMTLRDAGGTIVDEVFYDDSPPWPGEADGDGPSAELIDPLSDNSLPQSWLASVGGPTPGAENSVSGTPPSAAVTNVVATPFEPAVNQAITVVASAPVGTANPTLYYVVDFGSESSLTMTDDGVAPDVTAGDGVYTALIPGQGAGDLVRYRIDSGGDVYPTGDGRNYDGVVVDDPNEIPTGMVNFEWFIPDADYNTMFDDPLVRDLYVYGSVLAIDGVVYDNMTVKIRGGNFAREFKDKQGLSFDFASGVDADLPQLVPHAIDEFALSAEWGNLFDRTYAAWEVFDEAGFPPVPGEHVRVQRNGEYYGIFRFTEKLDGTWRDENDIDGEFYKAVGQGFNLPANFEKKQPDDDDRTNINAISNGLQDPPSAAKTEFMFDNFDIPNLVNYLAAANLVGHFDSEGQNFYVHRDAPAGLWQVYPWDLTNTFGISASFNGCGNTSNLWISCNDNPLWNSVEDTPELEEMVWRRMRTLLDGPMADGVLEGRFAAYRALISEAEITKDEAEWDDQTYSTNSQFNGRVDTRRNLFLAASDLPSSQASAPGIVITEIVHSPENGPDWLELYNPTSQSVDLSGWTIDGVDLEMPGGTVLLAGEYMVATRDIAEFLAEYPSFGNVVLVEMSGGLSGGGELLELITAGGVTVDSVDYGSSFPWPFEPNAGAVTMSLFEDESDNGVAEAWGISQATGGTPGEENDTVAGEVPVPPAIVINEIHYNPADGGVEFIELYNAEADPVDMSGWELGGFAGDETIFPAGTVLAAGDYLVITEDLALFQTVYPGVTALEWVDGGLSNGGEDVELSTEVGLLVDAVAYDDEGDWPNSDDNDPSPDGDGPSIELIDPALDNAVGANWEVSLGDGSPGATNIVVDTAAPNTTIDSLSPVSPGLVTITGNASDSESSVSSVRVRVRRDSDNLYWDGSGWVVSTSTWVTAVGGESWSLVDVPVEAGSYQVRAYSTDLAGNVELWANGRPVMAFLVPANI